MPKGRNKGVNRRDERNCRNFNEQIAKFKAPELDIATLKDGKSGELVACFSGTTVFSQLLFCDLENKLQPYHVFVQDISHIESLDDFFQLRDATKDAEETIFVCLRKKVNVASFMETQYILSKQLLNMSCKYDESWSFLAFYGNHLIVGQNGWNSDQIVDWIFQRMLKVFEGEFDESDEVVILHQTKN